jgi:hypothetical protein
MLWADTRWQPFLPWDQAFVTWDPTLRAELPPSMCDMVLLREFRNQLDPNGGPRSPWNLSLCSILELLGFGFHTGRTDHGDQGISRHSRNPLTYANSHRLTNILHTIGGS